MPKSAQKKPRTTSSASPATDPGDILTLSGVAALLQVSEDEILQSVQQQGLPGRQVATQWRFSRAAILIWLSQTVETTQSRKEAQLALVGKYRDDPDLLRICEEAYRQRRGTEGDQE